MKKLLFVLTMLIASISSVYAAEEVTGRAATFRTQAQAYLRTEGYIANIDDDGDISFKSESKSYYISVENYDDGVYVNLYSIINTEGENQYKVLKAANKAQHSLKFVRINSVGDSAITINFTHYFDSITQFKTLFPDMLYVVKEARTRTIDNFAEL